MKDIDFDELDKAVTSLMGGVPAAAEVPRPDDGMKTLVLKPNQPMDTPAPATAAPAEPAAAPAAPESKAETTPTVEIAARPAPFSSSPATSLATRRGGRFMDVMHPSSDMGKTAPAPAPVSRSGGTIEPLNPVVLQDARPVEEPAVASEPAAASEWPDPLDMPQAQQHLPATDETLETPTDLDFLDTTEPLASPFLPDAKVEKRPLGGFASEQATEPAEEPAVAPQEAVSAPADSVILPEELQGDLMAIESSQADTTGPAPERVKPAPQMTPAAPTATSVSRPQPTGPASIQQQYKESPSSGDTTNGAIYDTDAYHQPLRHPAAKKPGWFWIVWIVVLLIVGAGGGALAYLFLLK